MTRSRSAISAVLALLLLILAVPAGSQQPSLVVLHFNDVYQLAAVDGGKAGGLDRLTGLIRQHQARERCTLVLFAGDLISPSVESSVSKGAQLIDGFNLLGVDAATLGNHEFDYGPAELQKRIAESRFPWVIANAFVTGVRPFPGTRMYIVRDVCGTPVGIFGLLTPETETASSPGTTWFGDPIAVARSLSPSCAGLARSASSRSPISGWRRMKRCSARCRRSTSFSAGTSTTRSPAPSAAG